MKYRPFTAFFGWTAVGWGIWLLLTIALDATDREPPAPENVPKDAVLLGFVSRLYATEFQHGMVVLLIGTVLYALFQAWALAKDDTSLEGQRNAGPRTGHEFTSGLLVAFSGRPRGFWRALSADAGAPAAVDHDRLHVFAEHVRFGSAAGMTPLRLALWVFPMYGFLGTVIGLSWAIGDLAAVVSQRGGVDPDTLKPVLTSLNVAFDTTIQGILSAVLVILMVAVLDRGWERLEHRLKILNSRAAAPLPSIEYAPDPDNQLQQ